MLNSIQQLTFAGESSRLKLFQKFILYAWWNASKIALSLSKFGFTKRKINISTFKIVLVFIFQKYRKLWSVSQGHCHKHKPLISEEWLVPASNSSTPSWQRRKQTLSKNHLFLCFIPSLYYPPTLCCGCLKEL